MIDVWAWAIDAVFGTPPAEKAPTDRATISRSAKFDVLSDLARSYEEARPLSSAQEAVRLVREGGKRPKEAALATGARLGTVYTALFRIREREQRAQEQAA